MTVHFIYNNSFYRFAEHLTTIASWTMTNFYCPLFQTTFMKQISTTFRFHLLTNI